MPAYLVVTATVTDPQKMGAYQKALAESGLYAAHGGRYVVRGRPAADLENWDGRAVVIAEFPDRAAAEAFWTSDSYQREVKPLRAGAGEFHVAIFEGADSIGANSGRADSLGANSGRADSVGANSGRADSVGANSGRAG
jgi:uncharacterized protein (DUF1330 family)